MKLSALSILLFSAFYFQILTDQDPGVFIPSKLNTKQKVWSSEAFSVWERHEHKTVITPRGGSASCSPRIVTNFKI